MDRMDARVNHSGDDDATNSTTPETSTRLAFDGLMILSIPSSLSDDVVGVDSRREE